nr:putative capsid protein [Picobirnavirus sp.]
MTNNQISYFKAKEDERHNRAVEEEQRRSNLRNEQIKQMEAETAKAHYERSDTEQQRSNLVKEQQNATVISQDYTKLAQEQAKIQETIKHNRASEEIDWINANAKAKDAAAKMVTAQSTSELNYAKAGLTYAQTAHTDIQAMLDAARTDLTNAQTDQALVTIPNIVADTQLKRSTRDKVITETSFIPLNTWSNVIRNFGIGGLL